MAVVGKDCALITAGTPERFNSLTVRYGAIGMIWKKDVYIAFIKPERYTWSFVRDSAYFTVSFFPETYQSIHRVFGFRSGRDTDKVKLTGITPEFLEYGITYREANEIYVCRKLYMRQMDRNEEPAEILAMYDDPEHIIHGETHYAVIGEITEHIVR